MSAEKRCRKMQDGKIEKAGAGACRFACKLEKEGHVFGGIQNATFSHLSAFKNSLMYIYIDCHSNIPKKMGPISDIKIRD